MGSLLSRGNNDIQQIDIGSSPSYVYPPTSGSYFGAHFFMGGKKFDIAQPEAYLFGDNSDLNFLGPKPFTFPYQAPSGNQPVRALKCMINIRKDSLRLIRVPGPQMIKPDDVIVNPSGQQQSDESVRRSDALYNIEFTFDADCPCSIAIYYNASEEIRNKAAVFTTNSPSERTERIHYNAGCNQQFCLTSHVIDPAIFSKNKSPSWDFSHIPIVIQATAEGSPELAGHAHIMYASFEQLSSGDSWTIKPVKQKQMINGVGYIIQEIYGIENKQQANGEESNTEGSNGFDDDGDNSECVVCLSDPRDTLILPCKHLCLCSSCANQLRFQQSGCPICRQSFRALLQIRAVRKKVPNSLPAPPNSSSIPEETVDDDAQSVDSTAAAEEEADSNPLPYEVTVPAGYEVVPLISAINGPASTASLCSLSTLRDGTRAPSVASNVSASSSLRRSSRKKKNKQTGDAENETQLSSSVSVVTESGHRRSDRKKSKRRSQQKRNKEAPENKRTETLERDPTSGDAAATDATEPAEAEIDSSAGAPVKTSEEDEDHAEEHAQIESQLQPPQDAASVRNHASSVTSSHLAGDGFEEQQDTSVVTSTDEEVLDGATETDQSTSSSTSTHELLSSCKAKRETAQDEEINASPAVDDEVIVVENESPVEETVAVTDRSETVVIADRNELLV